MEPLSVRIGPVRANIGTLVLHFGIMVLSSHKMLEISLISNSTNYFMGWNCVAYSQYLLTRNRGLLRPILEHKC